MSSTTPAGQSASQSADATSQPSPQQLITSLPDLQPGDSPALPKLHEDLLNDGIADQVSRRRLRTPIFFTTLAVLFVLTVCLAGVVSVLGSAFLQALKPDNTAKLVALELAQKTAANTADTLPRPLAASASAGKSEHQAHATLPAQPAVADTSAPKLAISIYTEIRDAMVPLVALVSILAVAIVVILGTMLKAAFAPHPNNRLKDTDETSPVPVLEAMKSLVDSVKAVLK